MPYDQLTSLSRLWLTGRWQYWSPKVLELPFASSITLETLYRLEKASPDSVLKISNNGLSEFIERIATNNSFWESYLIEHIGRLNLASIEKNFKTLPILDKLFYRRIRRQDYLNFIPGFSVATYFTSGSSGIPFWFALDELSSFWRSLLALRGNRWAGIHRDDKFIRIFRTGYPDPMRKNMERQAVFLEWNRIGKHYDFLRSYQNPAVIYGFIGYFRDLMQHIPSNHALNIRSLIVTGEHCGAQERMQMESFFNAPVYASYSSREFGRIAQECEYKDGYHINAERFLIEVVDNAGNPLPNGSAGKILITDTRNFAMPFLRFDIGDMGYISDLPCRCGRTLPRLYVEDRSTDQVKLSDGKKIRPFAVFGFLNNFRWILRYQVVQRDINNFAVFLRTIGDVPQDDVQKISAGLGRILGNHAQIIVKIDTEEFVVKNGKQLTFISEIAS